MAPKAVMIEVDIVFSKPIFMPGENVEGTVTLTTNQTEDALENLTLEITGTESAYVPCADRASVFANPLLAGPTPGFTGQMTCVSEHRQICRGKQTLATLSNEALEPRTHSWPFKFKIPAGAPPTQKTGNAKNADMWEVTYEAYARLEFSARDKHRGVFGRKAPIRVWCQPRPHVDTPPKVVGPEVFPVHSRVPWGKSRRVTLAVKLARTTFSLGEPIEVSILARKASSITIREVLIEVVQTTAWSAKGKRSNAPRVLASRVVQTGELQSPVGQQLYFGDGTPADTMAGLESQDAELASSLLGGACGVFEIQVPEEKHDYFLDAAGFPQTSFGTKLDQFVRVTVKAGKASGTMPAVMCPIQVVNNMAQTK